MNTRVVHVRALDLESGTALKVELDSQAHPLPNYRFLAIYASVDA